MPRACNAVIDGPQVHATRLFTVHWNSGPAGAGATQFLSETFPLVPPRAVLIAHATQTPQLDDRRGVQLYFGARVGYLALYAAGAFLLRSLVWNVATLGIAMVLLSLVLNDASAVEHAARSGLYCRSLACDHSFSLGHCTSVQSAFVR